MCHIWFIALLSENNCIFRDWCYFVSSTFGFYDDNFGFVFALHYNSGRVLERIEWLRRRDQKPGAYSNSNGVISLRKLVTKVLSYS